MRKPLALASLAVTVTLGACGGETDPPLAPVVQATRTEAATVSFGSVWVHDDADAGPGSFRAAVEAANADPSIHAIRFRGHVGVVALAAPVTYTGSQGLAIDGHGVTIDAGATTDGFVSNGGADLWLTRLTVRNAGEDGVQVDVPASATGEIVVDLHSVTIAGAGEYGLHVDDQAGASAASIRFSMIHTRILDNGFAPGKDDRDGVRIDEGGPGGIVARIQHATVTGNAADGVEFDEQGDGDVRTVIVHTAFEDNGTQPQLPSDLEDGFDIDEADDGSIDLVVRQSSASRNEDGGFDLDEEGPGDIVAVMTQVTAADNLQENIKLSEDVEVEETEDPDDGSGGIYVRFAGVRSFGSGDNGIQLEEFGNGDVNGVLLHCVSSANGDDGLNVDQQDAGGGTLRLIASVFEDNADDDVNVDGVSVVRRP